MVGNKVERLKFIGRREMDMNANIKSVFVQDLFAEVPIYLGFLKDTVEGKRWTFQTYALKRRILLVN